MAAAPRTRLVLPPYKLAAGSTNDYFVAETPFEAASWDGVPICNRPLTTPIATHRGMYFANEFVVDPESELTSPYTRFLVSYPFQQYGKGIESTALARVPTMLLFDVNAAPSNDLNPPALDSQANQSSLLQDAWSAIITPNEDLLTAYNVFVGTIKNWLFTGSPYFKTWLPAVSETAGVYTNPYNDSRRDIDASYFLGGNLLHIEVVYINFINNGIASQYVERDQVGDTKTEYPEVVEDDQEAVLAAAPRFNRYRKIVYYKWYRDDADLITVSDDLYASHQSWQAAVSDYFTFRGPYRARDNGGVQEDDITSVISDDIVDFFSW